jgi:hypothetical protein
VFAFVNVNVPEPNFVNVPVPVVIAAIDDVPTLSTVNPMSVPVTPPDNVSDERVSICTSDAANIVTAPEIVFVPLVLRIAPTSANDSVTPSPLISIGSATVKSPDNANVALFSTVVLPRVPPLSPSAVLSRIATTPVEIVVFPVYVFALVNVSVPAPSLVSEPLPEITFPKEMASLRLKVRFALLVTLPLTLIEPTVPPAPIERVPAVIVVPPE